MRHDSTAEHRSQVLPGVTFELARMSLGRRIDLTRRIREIGARSEFLAAGREVDERIEGALLSQEIERTYLEWGLMAVRGLEIDGMDATPAMLIEKGPESLCREAVAAIRAECGLTEEERKN